jgi:murein DD-endopeptidase MepM/ murein hydrolase activator NlpD
MGKLILIILFLSSPAFAKVRRPKFNSLTKLQSKIFSIEKDIFKITGDLEKLENKLEEKNKAYLENLNQKRNVEEKLAEYRTIIENEKKQLQLKIDSAQESFRAALLTDVDKNDYPKNILGRKMLKNILKKNLDIFYQGKLRLIDLGEELTRLEKQYLEHIQTEGHLVELLNQLENKKKKMADNYYHQEENKKKWKIKYNKLKSKLIQGKGQKKTAKIKALFSSPLEGFSDLNYKNKGITFKYKGVNQVLASRSGKIVYSGKLSTYGNVVIIDHGKNTRSVVLGNFNIKIKKGEKVEKGDVLGYTTKGKNGKLYFEVRKKDKAQKTILFMDGKFISKNTIKKKV